MKEMYIIIEDAGLVFCILAKSLSSARGDVGLNQCREWLLVTTVVNYRPTANAWNDANSTQTR